MFALNDPTPVVSWSVLDHERVAKRGWEALRRACLMGQGAGVGSIGEVIAAIGAQAANEVGRIDSLARACAAADDRAALVSAFETLGFTHDSSVPVSEASGRAIADFLVFHLKH